MRPSAKPKEERKWVLDTINKYFDVIVEEEDEEDEDDDEDSEMDSEEEMESDEEEEEEYDSENDDPGIADPSDFKSTSRIRSLLTKAASNVSESQSNLATLNMLKQKLGSRISLGLKQSVENLSSL